VRAIILAAGRGLRLKQPLDTEVPKCLLQFGGRTMLERHLQLLKNAGVEEVVLALGYLYESVEAHLKSLRGYPRPQIVLNPRFELGSVLTCTRQPMQ
jgi:choline kinase